MCFFHLSYKIKDIDLFISFLRSYDIVAYKWKQGFNLVNGEKVTTNEHRKLINDLYDQCFKDY